MLAVIVTGPPGAGKTRTSTLVHDYLGERGIPNALIELDQLARCYPASTQQAQMQRASSLANSYREEGHELLFVDATVVDDTYRRDLQSAIRADATLLIRLRADPRVLPSRLRAREPDWDGVEALIADALVLADAMESLACVDLVLDTGVLEPFAVSRVIAEAVMERRG